MSAAMRLWMDRYDALSLRERGLIALALLGFIALAWNLALLQPLMHRRNVDLQRMVQLRADVARLQHAAHELDHGAQPDPDRATREALAAEGRAVAALDAQLRQYTSGLVDPHQMAAVLERVLKSKSSLELVSLRAAAAEPLLGKPGEHPASGPAPIYRHGVELEMAGGYLDTLRFLQALQALPWKFFWDRAEFDAEKGGRVKLTLFTLSLQPGWIGV